MNVFLQVITLFLLMLAGFCTRKGKKVSEQGLQGMNFLVLYFAMPSLVLRKLQTPATPELLANLCWVFVLAVVTMGASAIIASMLFRKETHARKATLVNLSMASNCAYMGYPVITAALGEEALIYAVIYVAAFNLMVWTVGASTRFRK